MSASNEERMNNKPSSEERSQPEELEINGDHKGSVISGSQEEMEQSITPLALMLKMHYELGHLPFSKLKFMAKNGTLDNRMVGCRIPVCAACSRSEERRVGKEC